MSQTHKYSIPVPAAAALAANLRVKYDGSFNFVYAGASDLSLGTLEKDAFAAGDVRNILLHNPGETQVMVASGVIAKGVTVYAAAAGKIADTGTVAVGTSLEAAGADGDWIEVKPDGPVTASGSYATLTGTEELTNKTITAAVIKTGLTASGSAANTFASSTGTFITSSGANTLSGDVTIAATKRFMVSVVATPVAATGSDQSGAAALSTSDIVTISSDSAAKGVKLVTTAAGNKKILINTSATAAVLYPVSGGTLNGLSANAGVVIAASKCYYIVATAADTWTVLEAAKATAA